MIAGERKLNSTMIKRQHSTAGKDVVLHLLDSGRGEPLQTWRFSDQAEITIGRSDGNDVVIHDPHVSRLHVRLIERDGSWLLISVGRHGTLISDQPVAELSLDHRADFRLGPLGPTMRFETDGQLTHAAG